MLVVAGTPVIESPTAWVTISFPSTVTRAMTDLRWACAMVSRTIFITAPALVWSTVGLGPGGRVVEVHAASTATVQTKEKIRRAMGMPELGSLAAVARPLSVYTG